MYFVINPHFIWKKEEEKEEEVTFPLIFYTHKHFTEIDCLFLCFKNNFKNKLNFLKINFLVFSIVLMC